MEKPSFPGYIGTAPGYLLLLETDETADDGDTMELFVVVVVVVVVRLMFPITSEEEEDDDIINFVVGSG